MTGTIPSTPQFQSPLRGEVFGTQLAAQSFLDPSRGFSRLYAARCSGRRISPEQSRGLQEFQSPLRGEVFGTMQGNVLGGQNNTFQSPLRGEVFGTTPSTRFAWQSDSCFSRLYAARCSGHDRTESTRGEQGRRFSRLYAARCSGRLSFVMVSGLL